MKLVCVTEGVPTRDAGSGDGSSMISFELIRNLPADVDVELVTFGPVAVPAEVRDRCGSVTVLPERSWRGSVLLALASRLSIGAASRTSLAAWRTVRAASARADVTLLHGPHVLPLAGAVRGPLVVQVVDPWSRRQAVDAARVSGAHRWWRLHKARQSAQLERRLPRRAVLLTVGAADAAAWSRALDRPVTPVANGVDPVDVLATAETRPDVPTLCFVGSLDYAPNVASATRLVRDVLPLVRARVPGVRVVIAGRHPVPEVLALRGEGVEVLADVPSVSAVYRAATVAVFPDRDGLGVRNSVTEALAHGLPVVASSVAAREQPAHPGLVVADDDADLAARTAEALDDPAPRDLAGAPALRGWGHAAHDYLAALRRAIATP